jgi:ribosomal protein S18
MLEQRWRGKWMKRGVRKSRDRTQRFEWAGFVMIDFRNDFEYRDLRTIRRYISSGRVPD